MRLRFSKSTAGRVVSRLKNRVRIRKKIQGSAERPRLCVFRSGKHMYAQLVDDTSGSTLVAASTLKMPKGSNRESAKAIGMEVAKAAQSKNIKNVVFDRSGYLYHGRVKALADGLREAGLKF